MLRAKFHIVSSLLSVLKIAILMLRWKLACTKTKLRKILKVPLSSQLCFYTKVWLIYNHNAFWWEFHFNTTQTIGYPPTGLQTDTLSFVFSLSLSFFWKPDFDLGNIVIAVVLAHLLTAAKHYQDQTISCRHRQSIWINGSIFVNGDIELLLPKTSQNKEIINFIIILEIYTQWWCFFFNSFLTDFGIVFSTQYPPATDVQWLPVWLPK